VTPLTRIDWPGKGPDDRLSALDVVGTEGEEGKPGRYSFPARAEREGKRIREKG
jgi:hypothetical protein